MSVQVFENFYEKNFEALVKGVSFGFDTPHDAEDAVQEAFCRALRYIETYDMSAGNFEGWFRRILQNTVRDIKRDNMLKGMSTDPSDDLEDHDSLDVCTDDVEIAQVIKDSRHPARDILTLYFYKDFKPWEIAQALGMKMKTVRQALWRFKRKVRDEGCL